MKLSDLPTLLTNRETVGNPDTKITHKSSYNKKVQIFPDFMQATKVKKTFLGRGITLKDENVDQTTAAIKTLQVYILYFPNPFVLFCIPHWCWVGSFISVTKHYRRIVVQTKITY
jgi:hypothetical protein